MKALWENIVEWSKRTSFLGLSGIPIFFIYSIIVREISKDDIMIRANSMAFSFLMSIFPLLILVFTVIPFLPNQNLEAYFLYVTDIVNRFLPDASAEFFLDTIEDLIFRQRTGLLSVSIVLALYFASNGIMYMMIAFEKEYENAFKQRNYLYRRLLSVVLTLLLGVMFILSSVLIIFSKSVMDYVLVQLGLVEVEFFVFMLQWVFLILLVYCAIALIYRIGTNFKTKYGLFSPGTTVATILSIASSLAFSYYVNNFSNYNQIYGSLGALIILMLWLQINSFIILMGFELNASIKINMLRRKGLL